MSANLLAGTCRHECARTWAVEHGGALPGGPFPGHWGSKGDVRRCEHGRLWLWQECPRPHSVNYWRRISRFWEPLVYRRAAKAIAAVPGEEPKP